MIRSKELRRVYKTDKMLDYSRVLSDMNVQRVRRHVDLSVIGFRQPLVRRAAMSKSCARFNQSPRSKIGYSTPAPCKTISPKWRGSEIFAHSTRALETWVSPLREDAALGRLLSKVSFSQSTFMSSAELKEIIDAGHEL